MSVQEEKDMVEGARDEESQDMVSNVVKDAVVSVLDKDVNCEEELDVLEGA